MGEALLIAAARTPLAPPGGPLDAVHEADLLAVALRAVLDRAGLPDDALDEVVLGRPAGLPRGPRDPAWAAAIAAGLPLAVGGWTVDRGGLAGLQALAAAAAAVAAGALDLVAVLALAGQPPAARPAAPAVAWRVAEVADPEALLLAADPDLAEALDEAPPPLPASLAPAPGLDQDLPAAGAAQRGAAAALLASPAAVERLGLTPRARLVGTWTVSADPAWRLLGPARAAARALSVTSLRADDLDLACLDAPSALAWTACRRRLATRAPVHGDALHRGHAGPAEGLLLLGELLTGLEEAGGRLGLLAAAGDDGQAMAALLDRELYG